MATLKPDGSMEEVEKRVAAYVRRDVYGRMGRGELPWPEKVLLGLAMITLLPLRLALSIALLLLYYFICWQTLFLDNNLVDFSRLCGWRRIVIVTSARFLSRCLFFVFGFYSIQHIYPKVEYNNQRDEELERPGAIVSNHVSYIDILYHIYAFFPTFVAKRSVSNLPLVGLMRDCLGCVYVERDSKSSEFKSASVTINERVLEAQQNKDIPMIMLFPEGTTTNGDYLLPFKTGAFLPKAPVLPVILRYPYERFSPAWDTISPVRHMILLLCQFKNHLEVKRLPVYYPSQQEKDDPKLYADNVRRLMAREGNLKMTDIGLAEKWAYHAAVGNARVPTVLHHKDE